MKCSNRINNFLILDDGIDSIFKNLGQIIASGAIFKIGIYIWKNDKVSSVLTVLLSFMLFCLACSYGLQKIIHPLLKAVYGRNEKISQMEKRGLKEFLGHWQFITYLIVALLFGYFVNVLFDAVTQLK